MFLHVFPCFFDVFPKEKPNKHDTELAKRLEAFHQALHITALARFKTMQNSPKLESSIHNKQVM